SFLYFCCVAWYCGGCRPTRIFTTTRPGPNTRRRTFFPAWFMPMDLFSEHIRIQTAFSGRWKLKFNSTFLLRSWPGCLRLPKPGSEGRFLSVQSSGCRLWLDIGGREHTWHCFHCWETSNTFSL